MLESSCIALNLIWTKKVPEHLKHEWKYLCVSERYVFWRPGRTTVCPLPALA